MKLKEYESLLVAFFATIVRYYDYAIFGLSASIMSQEFMPGEEHSSQMLVFFGVFSLSSIARPLGSIIFGKIADHIGRVVSLKVSAFIAIISTSMIAFIPSFNSIGWAAVILIIFFRMLFLISLSGESDSIKVYVSEKVSKKRRHLAAGIVSFCSQMGVLIASIMYYISMDYNEIEWLWRVNFLVGGILGCVVIALRKKLQESQEFLNSKTNIPIEVKVRFFNIIADNKDKFLSSVVINGVLGGGYNFLIIFFGVFISNVVGIVSIEQASLQNVVLIAIYAVGSLISGYFADKTEMKIQTNLALISIIICVLVIEIMLSFEMFSIWLHRIIVFLTPFYTIPCAVRIQSLFPARIRMRMYSLSHSTGSVLLSSTTPFICMLIWKLTGMLPLVVGYFLIQLGMLYFILLYLSKKNYVNMFET